MDGRLAFYRPGSGTGFSSIPANWKDGQDVIIALSVQGEEELKKKFPKGYRAVKPYLRLTPQPNR